MLLRVKVTLDKEGRPPQHFMTTPLKKIRPVYCAGKKVMQFFGQPMHLHFVILDNFWYQVIRVAWWTPLPARKNAIQKHLIVKTRQI